MKLAVEMISLIMMNREAARKRRGLGGEGR